MGISNNLNPVLRFQGFCDPWKPEMLGNLCEITTGKLDANAMVEGGAYRFYTCAKDFYQIDHYAFDTDALLISGNGANVGYVHHYNGKFNAYQRTYVLDKFTGFIEFIRFKLDRDLRNRIFYESKAGNIPYIVLGTLAEMPLTLPSLPEQRKIADFLTAVDGRIGQLIQKKALLEDYKKGVMQQLFTQAIRFKDDHGNDFPDWEEKKLGELTYKVGKKNKEGKDLPVYSINNQEGFLPQGEQFDGISSKDRGFDLTLYKIVDDRTFAYNPARINVGSIGYSGELRDIIISSLYVCFRTAEPLLDQYLLHYLNTFDFNKAVLRNAEGGVRQYLFYENFSIIKIPLPSIAEQTKIADFLYAIDRKIQSVATQITETQTFKRGLLQQMFV